MSRHLQVAVGQYSDKGRKELNQDFHGVCIPREPQLGSQGHCHRAGRRHQQQRGQPGGGAVGGHRLSRGLLLHLRCLVGQEIGEHVLTAVNSWLHSQTQQSQHRYDRERGYVCTFSGMVIKSTTAHLFHVGDARIYRLRGEAVRSSN
jgi:hypothetical protein